MRVSWPGQVLGQRSFGDAAWPTSAPPSIAAQADGLHQRIDAGAAKALALGDGAAAVEQLVAGGLLVRSGVAHGLLGFPVDASGAAAYAGFVKRSFIHNPDVTGPKPSPHETAKSRQQAAFLLDVGSPATYLAWTRLPAICAATGAELVMRPMLLAGVFQAIWVDGVNMNDAAEVARVLAAA